MLLLTLRFFATGYAQRTGGDLSGISNSTACRVIRRVCHHIALLRARFVKFPSEIENQRQIQQDFYNIAKFPRVIAAVDCTHIRIISPGEYYKYLCKTQKMRKSFQVVTMLRFSEIGKDTFRSMSRHFATAI